MAEVAALLGDPGRAGMVTALWDGTARPAGELARIANVSAATASSHLRKLVAGGLLRMEPRGRHRYYRLASPEVAYALEAVAALLPPRAAAVHEEPAPLRRARMCYDHLAGMLGVALSDALIGRRWMTLDDAGYAMRPAGRRGLLELGVDVAALERGTRPLLRTCLDWTERREHIGGALGAALASQLVERDWLRRERRSRALLVTTSGRRALASMLGLRVA